MRRLTPGLFLTFLALSASAHAGALVPLPPEPERPDPVEPPVEGAPTLAWPTLPVPLPSEMAAPARDALDRAGWPPPVPVVTVPLHAVGDVYRAASVRPVYMPYNEVLTTGPGVPAFLGSADDRAVAAADRVAGVLAGKSPPTSVRGDEPGPVAFPAAARSSGGLAAPELCGVGCGAPYGLLPALPAQAHPAPFAGTEAGPATSLAPLAASDGGPVPWSFPAAAAGLGLAFPLWRLYRRLARDQVLRSPARRAVLALLEERPGLPAGTIARALGVDHRAATHHLRVLAEFGFLETRRVGGWVRYYRAGAALTDPERRARVALASEPARRVACALAAQPGASLGGLSRATGLPRGTVRWHVDRFRDLGLLAAPRALVPEVARLVVEPSASAVGVAPMPAL